ncbi:MAG: L-cystine-binding protein FliY [Chlamydiia bacterium]|nr:L-cystine-binding protein FliY [Chlamydiia bacterium]
MSKSITQFFKNSRQKLCVVCSFVALFCITSCSSVPSTGYTIALDPSWFPLDMPQKEPYILAFTKELLQKIGEKKGVHLNRITVSWDNLLEGLNKKDYQGVFSMMEPYLFNLEKYDFSDVYLQTGPVVVMREAATKSEAKKLYEKEIAVFSANQENLLMQMYPDSIVRMYDSIPKALMDVATGVLDGALVEHLDAVSYVTDVYSSQLKIVSKPLTDEGIKLLTLANENKELVKIFNEGLHDLVRDGDYKDLAKKWHLAY